MSFVQLGRAFAPVVKSANRASACNTFTSTGERPGVHAIRSSIDGRYVISARRDDRSETRRDHERSELRQ